MTPQPFFELQSGADVATRWNGLPLDAQRLINLTFLEIVFSRDLRQHIKLLTPLQTPRGRPIVRFAMEMAFARLTFAMVEGRRRVIVLLDFHFDPEKVERGLNQPGSVH